MLWDCFDVFNQFCSSSSKEKSETVGMKSQADEAPGYTLKILRWQEHLSPLFNSYSVNIRRIDGDRFHSGGNFGKFQFQCKMHFNSVQICFGLLFDSRRLIHMNSNEIFWMHSAFGRRIPPVVHMHTTALHAGGGYLVSMWMLTAARVQTIGMFVLNVRMLVFKNSDNPNVLVVSSQL